jgi:hypothetical protein
MAQQKNTEAVVLELSVQALREGGAVVSKNVYVDLSKTGYVSGSDSELRRILCIMSTNGVTGSLDSDKIVASTLKKWRS